MEKTAAIKRRKKGESSTKIYAIIDALGDPVKLTSGQRHDITQAEKLTKKIFETMVITNKSYDSQALVESLQNRAPRTVVISKIKK